MPKTITVQVHNADGDMTVSPSLVHVDERDSLTWQLHGSHAGKLALTLTDGAAFGNKSLGGGGPTITAKAAKKGTFHYHVAVEVAAGGPIPPRRYEDNYCPTVVIR